MVMKPAQFKLLAKLHPLEIIFLFFNNAPLVGTLHFSFLFLHCFNVCRKVLSAKNTCRVDFPIVKQHGQLPTLQSRMPLKALI